MWIPGAARATELFDCRFRIAALTDARHHGVSELWASAGEVLPNVADGEATRRVPDSFKDARLLSERNPLEFCQLKTGASGRD